MQFFEDVTEIKTYEIGSYRMNLYWRAMTDGRQDLDEYVDGHTSVLLLAPHPSAEDDETCIDLLTGNGPGDANVLSVTASRTPDERLALWRREVGERLPERATIVDAGSEAVTGSQSAASAEFPSVTVDALSPDAGLVTVGIAITRHLSTWESNAESTALCLHSLTTLLDSFDRERVLSLVRGLNDICDCMDVVAHHHMDPGAHSEETVAAFRPQYDVVVEHLPDHGWIVTGGGDTVGSPPSRRAPASPRDACGRETSRLPVTPVPYSLDTLLDVLSHGRRRSLLYHLRDRGRDTSVSLDELVDEVRARETARPNRQSPGSSAEVRLSLLHTHLPKLAEAGIVAYDADEKTVTCDANAALESCLEYVEMLESD